MTTGGVQLNSPDEGSLTSFPDSPSRTGGSGGGQSTTTTYTTADTLTAASSSSASSSTTAHQSSASGGGGGASVVAAAMVIANNAADGYATIDFDKTAALGVAFSSPASYEEEEQGLRKTRHNCTMMVTSTSTHSARQLGQLNRQTSSVSE